MDMSYKFVHVWHFFLFCSKSKIIDILLNDFKILSNYVVGWQSRSQSTDFLAIFGRKFGSFSPKVLSRKKFVKIRFYFCSLKKSPMTTKLEGKALVVGPLVEELFFAASLSLKPNEWMFMHILPHQKCKSHNEFVAYLQQRIV